LTGQGEGRGGDWQLAVNRIEDMRAYRPKGCRPDEQKKKKEKTIPTATRRGERKGEKNRGANIIFQISDTSEGDFPL